jgi:hypothetical protein
LIFTTPAAALPALDVADEVAGQVLGADVLQERELGVHRGDHDLGPQLVAVVQHDAHGPAVLDQHPGDPGVGADLRAVGPDGGPDGIGYRAHAALLEAPVPEVAVAHVADGVVGHHVGGAGLVGAGPGADDAVDRQGALDLR